MTTKKERLYENHFYRFVITVLALMATFLVAIETTRFDIRYHHLIVRVEYAVFGLLAADLLLNLILVKGVKGLGNYLFSLEGLVDIVSAIPIVIILLRLNQLHFLKLTFGIAAFLKIARFSDALSIFKDVIITERKSILASLYLMMLLTFSISTILYFVERDANPNGFSSILESMWWSIVTLATVGYGDVVPVTALGKFLGALASIIGLGMFALPAGILANGFAQELARIKYITSWNLVAKVPIFSNLDRGTISEIAKMLTVKRFSKNEVIIKHGDIGDAMYFILEGEVEVEVPNAESTGKLKKGQFFGEIALLNDNKRTATVTAKGRCETLELTSHEFKRLIASRPEIAKKIESVAQTRLQFD